MRWRLFLLVMGIGLFGAVLWWQVHDKDYRQPEWERCLSVTVEKPIELQPRWESICAQIYQLEELNEPASKSGAEVAL